MKIVVGVVVILVCLRILLKILPRSSTFRKNVKPAVFITTLGVLGAVIIYFLFFSTKQLAIMIGAEKQMSFLKEASFEEKEQQDQQEIDSDTLVIEVGTERVRVGSRYYDDIEKAKEAVKDGAIKSDKILLIDNYATRQTYESIRDLVLAVGIEEGKIQEKQEP